VGASPGRSGGRRAGIVRLREDVMLMEMQTQQVDTKLDLLGNGAWEIASTPAALWVPPLPANDPGDNLGWASPSTILPLGATAVIRKVGRSV